MALERNCSTIEIGLPTVVLSHQKCPPPHPASQAPILSNHVSLAHCAQTSHSARLPLESGRQSWRHQVDPSILSRMITAPRTGGNSIPIRVASVQDFRRSANSLNTVPELPRHPQAFALQDSGGSHRPMPSNNPLLKLMEQRMAANRTAALNEERALPIVADASPAQPPLIDDNRAALQASINKWSGIGNVSNKVDSKAQDDKEAHRIIRPVAPPHYPVNKPRSGRVPLSHLQNLTTSQRLQADKHPSQHEMLQQLMLQQARGMGQRYHAPHNSSQAELSQVGHSHVSNGLTRCAVSFAEVDRLRRENQCIQQMKEQATQELMAQKAYLRELSIAASALEAMQNNGGRVSSQFEQLNQVVQMSSAQVNSLSRSMNKSKSSCSLRKRQSVERDDDESVCSKGSRTTCTRSMSSAASLNQCHRALSHCSSRVAVSDHLENLRSSLISSSNRNESFSSGLSISNQSNQSYSSSSLSRSGSSQATLNRSSSNNNWLKSLLLNQESSGNAFVTVVPPVQNSPNSLVSLSQKQSTLPPPKVQVKASPVGPIQVKAEEFGPPSTGRSPSVIVSAVPDRIKFQDVATNTKPIDVVKKALSSRGVACDTKPSLDIEDHYFTKVTEMYDQETVNAVRSNNVVHLRKMHGKGINLQCGNRFGETLIHLACRRSDLELILFLVNEVGVSLRVRDDFGRTPWHDACWRTELDLDLLDFLLEQVPELLMTSDKRGHTPLDYARREHWVRLIPFLRERSDKFQPA